MFPTFDPDRHSAFQTCQLPSRRLRHYSDVLLLHSEVHARTMLQDETAAAPAQLARHSLKSHIRSGTFRSAGRRPRRQHLPEACALQVPVKLLVGGKSWKRLPVAAASGRRHLDVEASSRMHRLPRCIGILLRRSKTRTNCNCNGDHEGSLCHSAVLKEEDRNRECSFSQRPLTVKFQRN